MASRRQILFQVIQEKIPLGRAPIPVAFGAPIKAGRERSDAIKPCPQIGQRFERFDRPDKPRHTEKIDKLSKERELFDVETKNFVSQLLEKIKEKSAAASKVQNALARATMQPQVLDAFAVFAPEPVNLGVLHIMICRSGVTRLNLAQPVLIEICQQRPQWQRPE